MANNFILSSESTIDLPITDVNERNIPIIHYAYTVDGMEYTDNMDKASVAEFYEKINAGAKPTTSQLNEDAYTEFFAPLVEKSDVLHLAFGSGMSGSVYNAIAAANNLNARSKHKITVIDTTCSCCGFGLILNEAADKRDEGKSLNEIAQFVESIKHNIHHQFFSTELSFFKRSGRMSATVALIGTILGKCPIMHLNYDGRIIAYDKARGKKKAIQKTLDEMIANAQNGTEYSGRCYIGHSNCPDLANEMKDKIMATFHNLKDVSMFDIGPVIASHCGPGTVAIFFIGKERVK